MSDERDPDWPARTVARAFLDAFDGSHCSKPDAEVAALAYENKRLRDAP